MENKLQTIELFDSVEKFQAFLNKEPEKSSIKINKFADNSKFIPIGTLQNKIDELTGGLWETYDFKWQLIANELGGSIILRFYHPVAQIFLRRTGAAGTPIQMKSEKKGGTGDLTDINQKIKNTVVKDLPHLLAECEKSAIKKLGKCFGRDLNREIEAAYTVESMKDQFDEFEPKIELAKSLLMDANLNTELKDGIKETISKASSKKLDEIIVYLRKNITK